MTRLPYRPARRMTIDIIGDCQSKCVFCYNKGKKAYMDFAGFVKVLEESPNLHKVEIGGGEPLLHKDICRMVAHCLGKGIRTDVSTNGLIYPEELLSVACDFPGMFTMQINLAAAEERTFDSVTQTNGNFPHLRQNIEWLASVFPDCRLRLTLCRENLSQIGPSAMLARDMQMPLIICLMVPFPGISSHMITKEEAERAYAEIALLKILYPAVRAGWKNFSETSCPAISKAYGLTLVEGPCGSAEGSKLYVDAEGKRKGCEFLG